MELLNCGNFYTMAQHLDPKFLEHIGSVLLGTLSADSSVRSDAESTLFSLENQSTPNLLPSLLALSSSDIDPSIRQAAVLRLKNLVVSIWRLQPVHSYDNKARPQIVLSESDRQYLKMHIVPAIVQCGPFTKVRVQLLEVFYHIARVEFPDQWQDVYSICVQQVHSKSNIYSVLGGIACIRMLYKAQDNSPNENKEYFQALGRDALPLVLMTARETLSNESNKFLNPEAFPNEFEASMMIIKLIVKIFFLATKTEIDHVLFVQNLTFLHEWMEFLATIQLTDPGFGVKSISLPKAKKWAGRVMVRMIWRYCGEKDVEPRYKELGKYFLQNIAPKSVQIALGTMESMTKIADIHKLDKVHVLYSTLEFIRFAIKYSALYTKQIKPKLNLILFQTIFRIFLLNEEEKFLLSNSPEEFIMKRVEDELAEHGFTDLR